MAHIRGQAPPTQERLKELFVLNEEKEFIRRIDTGNQKKGTRAGDKGKYSISVDGVLYYHHDLLKCYLTGCQDFTGSKQMTYKDKEENYSKVLKMDPFKRASA